MRSRGAHGRPVRPRGRDAEGMAIYACGRDAHLVVADQHERRTEFEAFDRRTLRHLGTFRLRDRGGDYSSATDGIDILQVPLRGFPAGVLGVCDGCGANEPDEVDLASWENIARAMGLRNCPADRPTAEAPPP